MKTTLAVLSLLSLCAVAAEPLPPPGTGRPVPPPPPAAKKPLTGDELKKALYALGVNTGKSLAPFSLSAAELAEVQKGFNAAVLGKVDSNFKMEEFFPKIQELFQQRQDDRKVANKKKGDEYLAKMAQTPGYTKLPSGLLIKTVKEGTGPSPAATDKVKVNYEGTLIDGKVFDSSYKRGEPASFPLNGVIRCWTEGVQKMKVGGTALLVCPADIAYGDRGAGQDIPPGATLNFKVELLSIEPPAPAGAPAK